MDHPSPSLPDDAERPLTLVAPRKPGEPLRPSEEARILDLAEKGQTQQEIAAEIGCHQTTVSRTIAEYSDTRTLARKFLEAKALPLSRRFAVDAPARDVLKLLGKLDVVRDDDESSHIGIQVVLGSANHPAVEANSIAVEILDGTARNDDENR